jgi:hypothetical protein
MEETSETSLTCLVGEGARLEEVADLPSQTLKFNLSQFCWSIKLLLRNSTTERKLTFHTREQKYAALATEKEAKM